MNRLVLPLILSAAPLLAAGPPAKAVADRDLGLSRTSVFETPAPPLYQDEGSTPGEKPLPKRINRETPPVIPHGVSNCLPITRSSNPCMDCHAVPGPKKKGEATPIPGSHFVDLRHAPHAKGKQLAGSRYVCISCHVSRTDARLLVGSTYRP